MEDISIHALLAESDKLAHRWAAWYCLFLSTLSLRRATTGTTSAKMPRSDFYPRSPCGERQTGNASGIHTHWISIHALLAESDPAVIRNKTAFSVFLSTLSLRRATRWVRSRRRRSSDFYPRSPCGERLFVFWTALSRRLFLSTLSLRRATSANCNYRNARPISIHALLAESDPARPTANNATTKFLSTLSLRRATCYSLRHSTQSRHFYPRSPCGERQTYVFVTTPTPWISIHALLAESDFGCFGRFAVDSTHFYPRSPCGERPSKIAVHIYLHSRISIHALLAESDQAQGLKIPPLSISIHALLAESDFPT